MAALQGNARSSGSMYSNNPTMPNGAALSKPKPKSGNGFIGRLNPVLQGLSYLAKPGSYIRSQTADLFNETRDRGAEGFFKSLINPLWSDSGARTDFWNNTGTGTYLQRHLDNNDHPSWMDNQAFKIGAGIVGDVALDPLSYLTGSSVLTGGVKKVSERIATEGLENAVAKYGVVKGTKFAEDALAGVAKKGAASVSKKTAKVLFPEAKVGLRIKAPTTGRIGQKFLPWVDEAVTLPVLPKSVTAPLEKLGAIPKQALATSKISAALAGKFSGRFPEARKMLLSGDIADVKLGAQMKQAGRLSSSAEASGFRLLADNGFGLTEGTGTTAEEGLRGLRATQIWDDVVRPAMAGNEDRVIQAVESGDMALIAATPGAAELKMFYKEVWNSMRASGMDINEISDYIPRIVDDEARIAAGELPRTSGAGNIKQGFEHERLLMPDEAKGETQWDVREAVNKMMMKEGLPNGYYNDDIVKVTQMYIRGVNKRIAHQVGLNHLVNGGYATEVGKLLSTAETKVAKDSVTKLAEASKILAGKVKLLTKSGKTADKAAAKAYAVAASKMQNAVANGTAGSDMMDLADEILGVVHGPPAPYGPPAPVPHSPTGQVEVRPLAEWDTIRAEQGVASTAEPAVPQSYLGSTDPRPRATRPVVQPPVASPPVDVPTTQGIPATDVIPEITTPTVGTPGRQMRAAPTEDAVLAKWLERDAEKMATDATYAAQRPFDLERLDKYGIPYATDAELAKGIGLLREADSVGEQARYYSGIRSSKGPEEAKAWVQAGIDAEDTFLRTKASELSGTIIDRSGGVGGQSFYTRRMPGGMKQPPTLFAPANDFGGGAGGMTPPATPRAPVSFLDPANGGIRLADMDKDMIKAFIANPAKFKPGIPEGTIAALKSDPKDTFNMLLKSEARIEKMAAENTPLAVQLETVRDTKFEAELRSEGKSGGGGTKRGGAEVDPNDMELNLALQEATTSDTPAGLSDSAQAVAGKPVEGITAIDSGPVNVTSNAAEEARQVAEEAAGMSTSTQGLSPENMVVQTGRSSRVEGAETLRSGLRDSVDSGVFNMEHAAMGASRKGMIDVAALESPKDYAFRTVPVVDRAALTTSEIKELEKAMVYQQGVIDTATEVAAAQQELFIKAAAAKEAGIAIKAQSNSVSEYLETTVGFRSDWVSDVTAAQKAGDEEAVAKLVDEVRGELFKLEDSLKGKNKVMGRRGAESTSMSTSETFGDTLPVIEGSPSLDIPKGGMPEDELSDLILGGLTPEQREIVSLRFGFDRGVTRTWEEVSQVLGRANRGTQKAGQKALIDLGKPPSVVIPRAAKGGGIIGVLDEVGGTPVSRAVKAATQSPVAKALADTGSVTSTVFNVMDTDSIVQKVAVEVGGLTDDVAKQEAAVFLQEAMAAGKVYDAETALAKINAAEDLAGLPRTGSDGYVNMRGETVPNPNAPVAAAIPEPTVRDWQGAFDNADPENTVDEFANSRRAGPPISAADNADLNAIAGTPEQQAVYAEANAWRANADDVDPFVEPTSVPATQPVVPEVIGQGQGQMDEAYKMLEGHLEEQSQRFDDLVARRTEIVGDKFDDAGNIAADPQIEEYARLSDEVDRLATGDNVQEWAMAVKAKDNFLDAFEAETMALSDSISANVVSPALEAAPPAALAAAPEVVPPVAAIPDADLVDMVGTPADTPQAPVAASVAEDVAKPPRTDNVAPGSVQDVPDGTPLPPNSSVSQSVDAVLSGTQEGRQASFDDIMDDFSRTEDGLDDMTSDPETIQHLADKEEVVASTKGGKKKAERIAAAKQKLIEREEEIAANAELRRIATEAKETEDTIAAIEKAGRLQAEAKTIEAKLEMLRVESDEIAAEIALIKLPKQLQNQIGKDLVAQGKARFVSNPQFAGDRRLVEAYDRFSQVFADGDSTRQFLSYYDKAIGYLKAWQLATPGFHVRNMMGGIFNNYLAGVDIGAMRTFRRDAALWREGKLVGDKGAMMAQLQDNLGGGGQYVDIGRGGSKLNPLSRDFAPLQWSAKGGEGVETSLRGALGWDRMRKGLGIDQAVEDIYKFHFNYTDLSQAERNLKRIVPFYTWTRYNVPLQMEMMLTNPGKYSKYMAVKTNVEAQSEGDGVVPDYFVNDLFGIRTPWSQGKSRVYVTPDLPFTTTLNQGLPNIENFDPGKAKSYSSLFDNYMSQVTPFIKMPLELQRDKSFFKNIPLPKDSKKKGKAFGMDNSVGGALSSFVGDSQKTAYILEQLFPAYARARRLFPTEEKYKNRRLTSTASTFGVPLRTNTPDEQKNELMRRSFLKAAQKRAARAN
jgi:DNA-directed RNA polymerase sigma subunit (sigma70/sigma32)